jgi:hypothetical protein
LRTHLERKREAQEGGRYQVAEGKGREVAGGELLMPL